MKKTIELQVQFTVPIHLTLETDLGVPLETVLIPELIAEAKKLLAKGSYNPKIDIIYEAVSKDENGQDQVPGLLDSERGVHNNVGAAGRKDPDNKETMQGNESGASERNKPGGAGEIGDAGQNRKEDEGRVHKDKTG
jgi:hypothetical protein